MISHAEALAALNPRAACMAVVVGYDERAQTVDVVADRVVHEGAPLLRFCVDGDLTPGMRVLLVSRGPSVLAIAMDWTELAAEIAAAEDEREDAPRRRILSPRDVVVDDETESAA